VARVLHVLPGFKVELVSLLQKLTALNVRLGIRVLEVTTTDHVYAGLLTDLDDLEIMWKHISSSFTVLGVLSIGGFVAEFVSSASSSKQVENIHFKSIIIQYIHLITDCGSSQGSFTCCRSQVLTN